MVTAKKVAPTAVNSESVSFNDSPFATNDQPSPDDVKAAAPEPPKSKPETDLIVDALESAYAGIGVALAFVPGAGTDGMIVATNATDLAESWRELLDNDPKVRRVLKKLLKSSAWGTVITAHMSVALAIMKNHPNGLSHLIKSKAPSRPTSDRETVPAN